MVKIGVKFLLFTSCLPNSLNRFQSVFILCLGSRLGFVRIGELIVGKFEIVWVSNYECYFGFIFDLLLSSFNNPFTVGENPLSHHHETVFNRGGVWFILVI